MNAPVNALLPLTHRLLASSIYKENVQFKSGLSYCEIQKVVCNNTKK